MVPTPAGQAGAADDDCRNDFKFEIFTGQRLRRRGAARNDHGANGIGQSGKGIDNEDLALHLDAGGAGSNLVAANGIGLAAKHSPVEEEERDDVADNHCNDGYRDLCAANLDSVPWPRKLKISESMTTRCASVNFKVTPRAAN